MKKNVYNFKVDLNWQLLKIISQIDRFDASWSSIEMVEGKRLKQLKSIATIQSIGASTRIEGSNLSDKEVKLLLDNLDINNLTDRDSQEVVGYFNTLDLISESANDIDVNVGNIKNIHNVLLKYSQKDKWHRGDYKQHVNAVQATFPDGTRQIIFKTTEPGLPTIDAMNQLLTWYSREEEVHPLVTCAAFVYDFLSIHPFQDGNGRLSRLLTTLLLLKKGYKWIEYVSFEHEIENNKREYYRVLRNCQVQRPNENITEWIDFFFISLTNIQTKLQRKLEVNNVKNNLPIKHQEVLAYISDNRGARMAQMATYLNYSRTTILRILDDLLEEELIARLGEGAGTHYTTK